MPHPNNQPEFPESLREHAAKVAASLPIPEPTGFRIPNFGTPAEDPEVLALCEKHGFGAVMASASRQWRARDPKGAKSVGDCFGNMDAARSPEAAGADKERVSDDETAFVLGVRTAGREGKEGDGSGEAPSPGSAPEIREAVVGILWDMVSELYRLPEPENETESDAVAYGAADKILSLLERSSVSPSAGEPSSPSPVTSEFPGAEAGRAEA